MTYLLLIAIVVDMYDPDHHKTIEALIARIGSTERCLELGLLAQDDNRTLHLTPAGYGYLIDVVAQDLTNPVEIYVAGWNQALDQEKFRSK